jgi:hypothetical protein
MEAASARDASARAVAVKLIVLAAAIAVGLVLQQALGAQLEAIVARAEHDRLAARAELGRWIRAVTTGACGLTAALGLALAHACRNPAAAEHFPPPGLFALGARRTLTGPRARALTRIGLVLGVLLSLVSLGGVALGWYVASVLLACRA